MASLIFLFLLLPPHVTTAVVEVLKHTVVVVMVVVVELVAMKNSFAFLKKDIFLFRCIMRQIGF